MNDDKIAFYAIIIAISMAIIGITMSGEPTEEGHRAYENGEYEWTCSGCDI